MSRPTSLDFLPQNEQDVGLLDLHLGVLLGSQAFVVIVRTNSECLLDLILANNVLVQARIDFLRAQRLEIDVMALVPGLLHELIASLDAVVADVRTVESLDEQADLTRLLATERAGRFFAIVAVHSSLTDQFPLQRRSWR